MEVTFEPTFKIRRVIIYSHVIMENDRHVLVKGDTVFLISLII